MGAAPARAASRRGAGGGGRGRRGAALEERAQARGARRGGQGEAAEGGPAPGGACAPRRQRPGARGWRGGERGGSRREAVAPGHGLRTRRSLPAGPPRAPRARPSRRLLLPFVSPPLLRLAPLPPAPGLPNQRGRVRRLRAPGRARRGPVPRPTPPPPAFPTVDERRQRSLWPPAERGAGLLGPSRPRGHPGSRLSASGAPSGARSFRLDWTERSLDRAEPGGCRARAEGIPAPSDRSYFGSRTGTPYARVTCGLRAAAPPDPSRPGPTRRLAGVGGHFSCPRSGSAEAPPLPPPRCLPGRL